MVPPPRVITATSIEDASHLATLYRGLTFVQTSGDGLPFEDKQFDIAFSTAVIEHVGDRERQRRFVAELLRVSKRYFITTPNRWYPVELHTYSRSSIGCLSTSTSMHSARLGKEQWATSDNLNLLDREATC